MRDEPKRLVVLMNIGERFHILNYLTNLITYIVKLKLLSHVVAFQSLALPDTGPTGRV